MTIRLTDLQRAALKEQFNADAANVRANPLASYNLSYQQLYDDIQGANSGSNSATGSLDPKSLYWYQQAITINGNVPTDQANVFIRTVTATGLQWDGLLRARDMQLQAISNGIAEAVIGSIVNPTSDSQGVVRGTDVTIAADISGALTDQTNGPITIGGWGGSFYYWNENYKTLNGSVQTVAQGIQGDATHKEQEQKFIAASATAAVAAVFDATSDPSVSSAAYLLTQWINNAFQGYYLLGSAPVPQYYKDEIRNRAIDVKLQGTAAGSPDAIRLTDGKSYFYLSSSKTWYYQDLSNAVPGIPDGPLYLERQADQDAAQTLDAIQAVRKDHQGFDSPRSTNHASVEYDEQDGSYIQTAEGDQGGYKIQGHASSDQLSTQTTVLADGQSYKAGSDNKLKKESVVALGAGDTIETNDQNAPTIQIGGFSGTASSGQGGNSAILMPETSSSYLSQVVFGAGAGNSVIRTGDVSQPDLDVQTFPGAFYSKSPFDQLHLHIVFASLNESDLNFYYKTIYDKDPVHYDFHTREFGYVQVKATGETLVLPQGGIFAAYLADGRSTGNYKSPSDFTFTFTDGTTVSGTALAALFDQEGASEHLEYSSIGSGSGYTSYKTVTGDIQNAPQKYLAAEQNGGGPAAPAASTGATTVTDTGTNVVFGFSQGNGTLEITPNYRTIVQFATSIPQSSVTVSGDSRGNAILNDGSGDQVVLDEMLTDPSHAVQSVSFADGTTWSTAQTLGLVNTTGTKGSDTLYGSYLSNVFDGQGASPGSKDVEVGNGGGDTFVFNQGYGPLEINEQDNGSNPTNTLRLGAGITASDVTASEDAGGDIILQLGANGDQVTLDGMASDAADGVQSVVFAVGTTWNAAQVFSLLGSHAIGTAGSDTLYGTWKADVFDGKGAPSGTKDVETGFGGGDTFIFNQGYGTLEINEQDPSPSPMNVLKLGAGITPSSVTVSSNAQGYVVLTLGTSGDQVILDGMSGGSFFSASSGVQSASFSDGTIWSADRIRSFLEPRVTGTSGADRLSGTSAGEYIDGKGAPSGSQDYENGGGGSDTFIYNQGYGRLEVDETDYYSYKPNNVLQFGAGITASQLTVTRDSAGNVYLADGTAGDQVKLDSELGGFLQGVQSVRFDNGTVLTQQQIATLATTGTTGADNLYGTNGADTFDGKGAPAGSQDYERGGGGNDTFIYNQGYGQLEVDETDYQSSDTNVLRLGAGITTAQITVTSDGSGNIYLTDGTAGDQIKLDGELNGSSYGVQSVHFADGSSLSKSQLIASSHNPGPKAATGSLTVGHGKTASLTSLVNGLVTPGRAGDTEIVTAVSATKGVVSLNTGNGAISYVAPASGSDTITYTVTYTVTDQLSHTATGIVGVSVDPGPAAATGSLTVGHGKTANLTSLVQGLITPGLAGDTEAITAIGATSGQASLTAGTGAISYVALASGSDTITYTVTDQLGDMASGTIGVNVDPGPTAGALSTTVAVGTTADLTSSILGADLPGLKGDVLTLVADDLTNTLGTVSLADGRMTYAATGASLLAGLAHGSTMDSFGYTVSDQYGDQAMGTVTVSLTSPVSVFNGPADGGGSIQVPAGTSTVNAFGYGNTIYDTGNNTVNAGQGAATVYVGSGSVVVNLSGYNNLVTGFNQSGSGATAGADGNVSVSGSQGNSIVRLGDGNDQIALGGYLNTVVAGNGTDTVTGAQGNSTVTLGDGADNVSLTGYVNTITLGNGNDVVHAGDGNETVTLGGGNDQVMLGGYSNVVVAGSGADSVTGGQGSSTVTLGDGADSVSLAGYGNVIQVGNGSALITAGAGSDLVTAGSGNDTVNLQGANNVVMLGAGTDVVNAANSDTLTLSGTNLSLVGGTGGMVFLNGGTSSVNDLSVGTKIVVSTGSGNTTISNFAADSSSVVVLRGGVGGYGTVDSIVSSLQSDGNAGTLLKLGSTPDAASIDFLGTSTSMLTTAHFQIG